MTILVCTFHPLFQRHFATELELIQRHLDINDSVTVLTCNADFLACDTNIAHDPGRCALCIQSLNVGLSLLSKGFNQLAFTTFLMPENRAELETTKTLFYSMEEMLDYQVENFDVGISVLSSIIGQFLISNIDTQKHEDLIRRYIISAMSTYRAAQNYLRTNQVDKVYIFNGRMSNVRAVLRACEQTNTSFIIHESGHDENTFSLFDNNTPHSITFITDCINKVWDSTSDTEQRQTVAQNWFHRRAGGVAVNGYSFVQGQEKGALPSDWDTRRRNIVIFTSSDYEFIAVSKEWDHHIYQNQLDGLNRIIAAVESESMSQPIHLTIRIHPNHVGLPQELEALLALQSSCVTVVGPKEKVSSYTLMQEAEKVLTFGSTAGIEAAFWDTPSILAGKSLYQNLGSVYTPQSHNELIELLFNKDLLPKDKEGTLKYAYFYNSYGQPFKYYKASTFFGGRFKGQQLFANKWLFRLHTFYKRIMPELIISRLNKWFVKRTLHRLLHTS
jgi:hypothetical protein